MSESDAGTMKGGWAAGQGIPVSFEEVRHLHPADVWGDHGRGGCRAGRGGSLHDHAVAAVRQTGCFGGAGRFTAMSLGETGS